jgi:eukaryotic-like serine/threonine-protein kinase
MRRGVAAVVHRLTHSWRVASHLSALDSRQWSELEKTIERFEAAWHSGPPPAVTEYAPADGPHRLAILCELVATDLQWRRRCGMAATVEGYLSEFPELSREPQAVVELAACEFMARRRAGLTADLPDFLRRFPTVAEQLGQLISEALSAESVTPSSAEYAAEGDGQRSATSRAQTADDLTHDVPRHVGRYRLARRIGGGSFGTVYEAIDTELGRRVAVKLPRRSGGARSEEQARFVREAQNLARLSHPAIVPVLDAGSSDGMSYIVCSLVDGPTLADRLCDGPLRSRVAAQIAAALADALDHAHRQGIVHRDVKPTNILFDKCGSPWLTDFGLASRCDADATLTVEGQLLGTPAYMAPEQAAGASHRVDGRSDVYSLGAVLYECLTGQLPFVGSPSAVLDQIRNCEPLPPTRICPRIERDLEMICLKAMEKRPADRYASAAEFGDDARRFLSGEPVRARPPGPVRRLAKWARRRPATAGLAGVALGAITLVTGIVWWHNVQLRGALIQTDEARAQAEALRLASEENRRRTEDLLYAADVRLARNSYLNGDRAETVARLGKYRSAADGPDRREFTWRRLWSLCHADQQTLSGHQGDVYTAQVVGDRRQLVSGGRDGTLRLWDLANDAHSKVLAQYPDELGFVALSPDGMMLATGGDDGMIRLWDLAAGRETRHFAGHADWALCGAISPQGNQLATSGRDKVIRLWTLPGGEPAGELAGHTASVESLAYLSDGKSLASTGADCTLRLWDLDAKSGFVFATHPLPAECVASSHDGQTLASGCVDYNIYVLDVKTRNLRGRLAGHTEIVQSVAFSPDDSRLASAGKDGTVRVWDMANLAQSESFMSHSSRVWSVAWFGDSSTLASAGGDGTVRLWRCDASRLGRSVSVPTEVARVHFSAKKGRIWLAARRQPAWAWDADGSCIRLGPPTGRATLLASARDADLLAVATDDYHLSFYSDDGRPLFSPLELSIKCRRLALSPAGDMIVVVSEEGQLCLYELPTLRLRWSMTLSDRNGSPMVEFTPPSDELLIACGDGGVKVCKVCDGSMQIAFQPRQLRRVTASPDGRTLAAGCSDRAIRVWDRDRGQEVACLQGHDGTVEAIAFAPDGQTLASGTSAGSVTLWHARTWQELGSFKTSLAAVNDVAFSPDGKSLAIGGRTTGDAGQVILWDTIAADD